ncbi:adenylyltransferase/cytidyltransferase family protein [Candidatus Proelusimicrobium excrementi]|mgnify:CR=1 FL=1|uniref:adenylyltransferase/cytidyltransferase family protein n=1 Tax=Candidatus Proelusimicrobium excrementi TaxID=3416222 RepID=UPI003CB9F8BA|nr:adenylyltransferase/cytidyltransferase family protein [Elusimicrobiaceae bacterium]
MKATDKILTWPQAEEYVKEQRKQGKSVAFTNGCFDILHAGHVSILEFSKNQADILILGINSDASVKRLKGPSRPINSQEDRALVCASLQAVDAVVVFDQDTPYELIKLIVPDVLIKGADYKEENVVGREFAKKVALYPILEGRSTTNTIKKAAQK